MDTSTATPAQIDTEIHRLRAEAAAIEHQIDQLRAKLDTVDAKIAPLARAYEERRWTRVYRVNNTNGHVHSTTACRNTYETTGFVWFPALSGSTPEQVVDLAGEYTCLTCWGAVRADILTAREGRPCRIETPDQEQARVEREARAAERVAKTVARDAKKLNAPVEVPNGAGKITTKAEAWSTLTAAMIDQLDWATPTYVPDHPNRERLSRETDQAVAILRAALIESLGLDEGEFQAQLDKKFTAKKQRVNREMAKLRLPHRY